VEHWRQRRLLERQGRGGHGLVSVEGEAMNHHDFRHPDDDKAEKQAILILGGFTAVIVIVAVALILSI
jgi:hypothetical protein